MDHLLLALLTAVLAGTAPQVRAKVTSVWVFGDDYLDLGTGAYIKNLARKCAVIPYATDSNGVPTGRCSNGNILTDQLAKQMGAVIGPQAGPEEYQVNGISFATAGSGALQETNPGKSVSLECQLDQFQDYLKRKQITNLNQSLVMISFGLNDYLEAILSGKDPMSYVDRVVPKIIDLITKIQLYSRAYRFVVLGVPPLGCLPCVRQKFFAPADSCLTNLNAVNEFHELRLDIALDALAAATPNAQPIYFSRFSLSTAFLDKSSGFPAFSKPWDVACGITSKEGQIYGCGQNVTYEENGQTMTAPVMAQKVSGYDYFWWDWLNPTSNAYYTLWVAMWMGTNAKAVRPMCALQLSYTRPRVPRSASPPSPARTAPAEEVAGYKTPPSFGGE